MQDRVDPAPPDKGSLAPSSNFFSVAIEGRLRKNSRLHRCIVARPRLLQPDHRVLHIHRT